MRLNLTSILKLRIYLKTRTQRRVDLRKLLEFNDSMPEPLEIKLAHHAYPINFLRAGAEAVLKDRIAQLARDARRSVVITDHTVAGALASAFAAFEGVPRFEIESGESAKSAGTLAAIWDFLAAQRCDRRSVLWVFGGGVVGDVAGFAAATYQRGIDFVQVPTTLLAMVDSSVGGKTGINLAAGKNLAGAFHHPLAVYVAPEWLRPLPVREFAAGAAEVIKYGLLGDAALFAQLEQAPLSPADSRLADVIRRCCALKAAIVVADERETAPEGGRALLNLGHTFGHAIENVAGYGAYLHGEAVAVGLCAAARLSQRLGFLQLNDVTRIDTVVARHELPPRLRAPLPVAALLTAMTRDKKNRDGGIRFVVLEALGRAATRSGVPRPEIEAIWRELGAA
jgi:3-dehydroquinate synthase